MTSDFLFSILLVVSLGAMTAQLLVSKKRYVHVFFAIFCGSIAMVALEHVTRNSSGYYSYVFGFGTCATCNGFWLVGRSLFRKENAIKLQHILLAMVIGALVMISHGFSVFGEMNPSMNAQISQWRLPLSEITNLLSSTILMLTFWEALNGFSKCSKREQQQRILFVYGFGSGVVLCSVISPLFEQTFFQYFVVFSATQIIVVTQVILAWQGSEDETEERIESANTYTAQNEEQSRLFEEIEQVMRCEKLYLQPGLKILDVATRLDIPEYLISKAIRSNPHVGNFNQYINNLRLEHAKTLLCQRDCTHWSILVVAIESGFASVGPFNRAFKAEFSCTPSEFRRAQNA